MPNGGECDQCGKPLSARACGPTHAIIKVQSELLIEEAFKDPDTGD
jgi:hypothetical protein